MSLLVQETRDNQDQTIRDLFHPSPVQTLPSRVRGSVLLEETGRSSAVLVAEPSGAAAPPVDGHVKSDSLHGNAILQAGGEGAAGDAGGIPMKTEGPLTRPAQRRLRKRRANTSSRSPPHSWPFHRGIKQTVREAELWP